MLGDSLQQPRAGQPITESFLRQLAAMAGSAVQGGAYYADASGVYVRPTRLTDAMLLRCSTETIPRGGVCITSGLTTGLSLVDKPILEAVKIIKLGQRPIFVALTEAAKDNYSEAANPHKIVEVLYDDTDGTPVVGETWGPVPSSWKVRKWHHGFKIVKAGDTTTKLALAVYDFSVPWYDGKMDVAIGPRETKAVSLYYDDAASGVDLTLNVDALAPLMLATGSIGIGKWVRVMYDSLGDRWTISAYQC
jgi:hypothetical protein